MRYTSAICLALLPLFASCGGSSEDIAVVGAATGARDLAASVRQPLEASNAAIERAKTALAQTPRVANPEILKSLEDAQRAVRDVISAQQQVGVQLDLVRTLGIELQREKEVLEREKASLQKDKAELERRELVWSTGFLAALLAALVALATAIVKYPLMRLDVQLKRIEIQEREHALRQKTSPPKGET